MRSKYLTCVAAFAMAAPAFLATSAPASAQRWHGHRGFGIGAGIAGLAAGALIGGAAAAAAQPWWGPGYSYYDNYGYYPGYGYYPVTLMRQAMPRLQPTPTPLTTTGVTFMAPPPVTGRPAAMTPTAHSVTVHTIQQAEHIWALTASAIRAHDGCSNRPRAPDRGARVAFRLLMPESGPLSPRSAATELAPKSGRHDRHPAHES